MANAYFAMLQAVENYYGAGSDQWITMANWTGYRSSEVAAILKQTPGVTVYTNAAGEIINYSVEGAASTMTAAEATAAAAANAINSNAVTAAVATKNMQIAGDVAAGAEAGTVTIQSGATVAASGSRVMTALGHIGTWILGAGVGLKLGTWIDAGLYNLNPDFWDAHNMESLNPETWANYKVTDWIYDYSGYDDFLAYFNASDEQMYVNQDLFALTAQYLASQGWFSGTREATRGDIADDKYFYPNRVDASFPVLLSGDEVDFGSPVHTKVWFTDNTDDVYTICWQGMVTQISKEPFVSKEIYLNGSPTSANAIMMRAKDGTEFYYYSREAGVYVAPTNAVFNTTSRPFNAQDFGYTVLYGEIITSGLPEGVNNYGQVPEGITSEMSLAQILALLEQQYPDLFNQKLKQGKLNDDGTITDNYYLPIGLPSGGEEGKPVTDPDYPGQVNPDNPTTVQIIERIIDKTPNPTPQPPDPGRGGGNTPTIVTPTGTADALYTVYNPTNAEIKSFGAWLWSNNFVDQLLKVFSDPMQAIISLHKIYASPHVGGRQNIKVGYLDSGVESNYVDQQYIEVDCGSVSLPEITASILDYDPFTDLRLYLPFIGIVKIDTADAMRGSINVKYKIDVLTGTVVAFVNITRDNGAGGVIYQYTGSCAELYPLSSGSFMGIITGVLGIAAGIAGTIATGGAAAPALLGGAAGLTAMHTRVEHSNGFSGNAGALACKKPYLIISRQQNAMSNAIGETIGYPANSFVLLSQCVGYTEIKEIHLTGIDGATDAELNEIEALLKSGVII